MGCCNNKEKETKPKFESKPKKGERTKLIDNVQT